MSISPAFIDPKNKRSAEVKKNSEDKNAIFLEKNCLLMLYEISPISKKDMIEGMRTTHSSNESKTHIKNTKTQLKTGGLL